jgi:hypothetical protein
MHPLKTISLQEALLISSMKRSFLNSDIELESVPREVTKK